MQSVQNEISKYLFLQVVGSLITGKQLSDGSKKSDYDLIELYSMNFDNDAIHNLNQVMKNMDLKIVLIDTPSGWNLQKIAHRLNMAGFEFTDRIVGQTMTVDRVKVYTEYDGLYLQPFPILRGNCVKHWVDNFVEKPYLADPNLGNKFEIWDYPNDENGLEKPEYRGMRVLKYGNDYKYLICSDSQDLLVEQIDKNVHIDFNYGLTMETAKKILLGY